MNQNRHQNLTRIYQFLQQNIYVFAFASLIFFTNAYIADKKIATLANAAIFGITVITMKLLLKLWRKSH